MIMRKYVEASADLCIYFTYLGFYLPHLVYLYAHNKSVFRGHMTKTFLTSFQMFLFLENSSIMAVIVFPAASKDFTMPEKEEDPSSTQNQLIKEIFYF